MTTGPIVLCTRVMDLPAEEVARGSEMKACALCKALIWNDPITTQRASADHPDKPIRYECIGHYPDAEAQVAAVLEAHPDKPILQQALLGETVINQGRTP